MKSRLHRLIGFACFAGLLALSTVGCGDSDGTSSTAIKAIAAQNAGTLTAAGAVNAYADALRQNDVRHLFELTAPKAEFERMRKNFETTRDTSVPDAVRARFTESLARLTAPDAVNSIMKELEPGLAKLKTQLPGYIMMATGGLTISIDSGNGSVEEKAAGAKAVAALQEWANKTDFADPKRARNAVTALVEAAKSLGIKSPEDVKALSFDAALGKLGQCLAGIKKALAAYDFNMDAALGSIKAVDDGKPGEVEVQVTLFGVPLSSKVTFEQMDGRWTR